MKNASHLQNCFTALCFMAIFLVMPACTLFHPYHEPIQQGNILEEDTVNRLHSGMSKAEVKQLLGNPVLKNTFHDDQMFYVYHLITNDGKTTEHQVILTFKNDVLIKITKN